MMSTMSARSRTSATWWSGITRVPPACGAAACAWRSSGPHLRDRDAGAAFVRQPQPELPNATIFTEQLEHARAHRAGALAVDDAHLGQVAEDRGVERACELQVHLLDAQPAQVHLGGRVGRGAHVRGGTARSAVAVPVVGRFLYRDFVLDGHLEAKPTCLDERATVAHGHDSARRAGLGHAHALA